MLCAIAVIGAVTCKPLLFITPDDLKVEMSTEETGATTEIPDTTDHQANMDWLTIQFDKVL